MNNIHKQIYQESFRFFLESTNEKEVLLEFVKSKIDLKTINTVLDIGGGSGALANPLYEYGLDITIVEPNEKLIQTVNNKNIKCIISSWENYHSVDKFDLIIAAYVFTHFKLEEVNIMLKKMHDYLSPKGTLLILVVDSEQGSWRKLHSFFYSLIGYDHKSSSTELFNKLQSYNPINYQIVTDVVTSSATDMLKALTFDFFRFEPLFTLKKPDLIKQLNFYQVGKNVILNMVHQAYMIKKQ